MHIIKPNRLRHGDIIGICAPASPPASEATLNRGIVYLEKLGFRIELGKNVLRKNGYLAGSDKQRAADLNSLFANSTVKAIFTVRGGYGSHRILRLLDYNIIKRNPKIFVGYSDITAIQFALLAKCGLVTFSGPMVATEMSEKLSGKIEEQFWNCLMSTKPPSFIKGKNGSITSIKKNKVVSGRLLGGNLSLITSLIGTPYFPICKNNILMLEEIDEKPYRIDRMLNHMKLAGVFDKIEGVALGDFSGCHPEKGKPSLTLSKVFRDTFQNYPFPIISGVPYGHIKASLPFPVGVKVRFNGDKNILEFLEAGVR